MTRTSHRVDVDGVVIAVEDVSGTAEPAGVPIVLLHGFTGAATAMRPLTDRLAATHRVLAIDLVGHGRSDSPADPWRYEMTTCASHVIAVVDRLAGGRADLVGYSMGARVGLSVAATRPGCVRRLVCIGGTPGLRLEGERADRQARDAVLADALLDDFEGFIDRWMDQPLFASQRRLGSTELAASRAQRLEGDPQGLAMSLQMMGTGSMPPLHDRLPGLPMPALFLAGSIDERFVALAEQLSTAAPHGDFEVIEGAGHATHLERPDETADAIGAFLAEDRP